jgi:hypothetical protein
LALLGRVGSDEKIVDDQVTRAQSQAASTGSTTEVPSLVTNASSRGSAYQGCIDRASNFIIKGTIEGSITAASSGTPDFLKIFEKAAPDDTESISDYAGPIGIAAGVLFILISVGVGLGEASEC